MRLVSSQGNSGVGANRGGWTTRVQTEIYPGIKTFMVEASPFHTGVLKETKKKFENFVDFEIAVSFGWGARKNNS